MGPLCPISIYVSPVALLKFQIIIHLVHSVALNCIFYTDECKTNMVISIDVRHLFFMWSVFAIKCHISVC